MAARRRKIATNDWQNGYSVTFIVYLVYDAIDAFVAWLRRIWPGVDNGALNCPSGIPAPFCFDPSEERIFSLWSY